jgi:hypothetical protein
MHPRKGRTKIMELSHLLNTVENYKESFGVKDNKYVGALCVELLRLALAENGIITSGRDDIH